MVDVKPGTTQALEIKDLYKAVESGKFALPEFQRPKVWKWKQERELLISLSMDVPIGSFLLWEYDSSNKGTHKKTVPHKFDYEELVEVKKPWNKVEHLVLDGQQRLGFLAKVRSMIGRLPTKIGYSCVQGPNPLSWISRVRQGEHWDKEKHSLVSSNSFVDELADTETTR